MPQPLPYAMLSVPYRVNISILILLAASDLPMTKAVFVTAPANDNPVHDVAAGVEPSLAVKKLTEEKLRLENQNKVKALILIAQLQEHLALDFVPST